MKRIKMINIEGHTILAEDLKNAKKIVENIIIECSRIYGLNDKVSLKAKRALKQIEDIRAIMDDRFFGEHPELDSRETPYYGVPGTGHGAKALAESRV